MSKPIIFSTPMVQAILEGRKTQTRRIVKNPPIGLTDHDAWINILSDYKNPYGGIGDALWVRETWKPELVDRNNSPITYYYLADNPDAESTRCKFKPSIHMPKIAARIFLEITNVTVQKLQDITPTDALNEGINYWNIDKEYLEDGSLVADFENYMWIDDEAYEEYHFPSYANCIDSYKSLWQKINGKHSWEANPWVWVIEFKKYEK